MTKTPRPAGGQVVKRLRGAGFDVVRRRGSRVVMGHSDGRVTVAPVHAGEILGKNMMSKIRRDIVVDRGSLHGEQLARLEVGQSALCSDPTAINERVTQIARKVAARSDWTDDGGRRRIERPGAHPRMG